MSVTDQSFSRREKAVIFTSMKPTVYIETTVVSYLTARPSRDLIIAAHQQITVEWWDQVLPRVDPFVSELVLAEIGKGDPQAASRRMERTKGIPLLEFFSEIYELGRQYFDVLGLPDKALADAYHVAVATWHGVDYVVTWNCAHIAGGRVERIIGELNADLGLRTPILCTPEELMEV